MVDDPQQSGAVLPGLPQVLGNLIGSIIVGTSFIRHRVKILVQTGIRQSFQGATPLYDNLIIRPGLIAAKQKTGSGPARAQNLQH